jgi:hypothetical protein
MAVGFDLVTIDDSSENTFVTANIAGDSWVGLTDRDEYSVEGTHVWQSGRSSAFTSWAAGEPNNATDEDCITIITAGTWNDDVCSKVFAYACEDAGVTNTVQGAEDAVATASCTTGTIQGWTAMYGIAGGGTCPVACGTCTLGASSCSVTFGNSACGDCNLGTVKTGELRLSCGP